MARGCWLWFIHVVLPLPLTFFSAQLKIIQQHNNLWIMTVLLLYISWLVFAYGWANWVHCLCSFLHARLRTSTLRSDYEGQSTILNLLLRNYLHYNLYDQADKLVSKSTFPECASNNEWARFLFYLGGSSHVPSITCFICNHSSS